MHPGLLASAYPKMFYSQGAYNTEAVHSHRHPVSRSAKGHSTVTRVVARIATVVGLGIGTILVTPAPANAASAAIVTMTSSSATSTTVASSIVRMFHPGDPIHGRLF
jgi:hypothetical protein